MKNAYQRRKKQNVAITYEDIIFANINVKHRELIKIFSLPIYKENKFIQYIISMYTYLIKHGNIHVIPKIVKY